MTVFLPSQITIKILMIQRLISQIPSHIVISEKEYFHWVQVNGKILYGLTKIGNNQTSLLFFGKGTQLITSLIYRKDTFATRLKLFLKTILHSIVLLIK
jgi:hypothetical protein